MWCRTLHELYIYFIIIVFAIIYSAVSTSYITVFLML